MIEIVLNQRHKQQIGEGVLGRAGRDGRAAGVGLFGDGVEAVIRALLQAVGREAGQRQHPGAGLARLFRRQIDFTPFAAEASRYGYYESSTAQ